MSDLIKHLSSETGLSDADVERIIARAPRSYKFYTIDKRTRGKRLISQPAREVKALQRALVKYLDALPIHESATAYRKGKSILDNAAPHSQSGPIKKYDFKDFFHSIRARDWETYCAEKGVFEDQEDVALTARLMFHVTPGSSILRLAMGAPSSPWLSNVLLHDFDKRLADELAKEKIIYTRYADDLTFSAPRTGHLNSVDGILKDIIRDTDAPELTINALKTVVATTKYRRTVTGLVLANDGRVTIGRDRKRYIRSAIYHALKGANTAEENQMLLGYIAFIGSVEPDFVEKLKAKYGPNFVERLSEAHIANNQ
ncbi:putative RNA-directed DNA polymerase [Aurantiacibacter atlanticus]|uniref:RNA-directed DNA polymerase n=1 Tax=Aurantiacibacter atlanticus TaxID=1648404 RepID=A0A0H4VIP6_9SPHN|nr:retron St85 family RNA-directed DNA polymerase [Aurantiacibacter atlanticus]AKQ42819.1 putative RNA-directed DNA polymerase [Aurantiacibacter atlanticus]